MQFRYSLENFRGLAILFVMLSHVASLSELTAIGVYLRYIVADATTWFVFISGYLFFYIEGKNFNYRAYLLKKVRYVVVPYLVLSVPAILAGLYFSRADILDLPPLAYVLWSLAVGGSVVGPMWFIPMIVIFFVLSPVFIRLATSRSLYLAAAAGVLFSLYSSRPINNLNPMLAFAHFVGFYIFGLSLAVGMNRVDALKNAGRAPFVMLLALTAFVACAFVAANAESLSAGFFDGLGILNWLQLGKLFLLIATFLFFESFGAKKSAFLGYFARISFGLFFIHGFYALLFSVLAQNVGIDNTAIKFAVEFLVVVVGSVATVYAVRLVLKKRSRYVIGC